MSTREERVKVFKDTMDWIYKNSELNNAVRNSVLNNEIFFEKEYPDYINRNYTTIISVTKSRSFEAAMRLKKENPHSKIAVLNFANAFQPGGGVVHGATAQEECLCRCSTLYPVLSSNDQFYLFHKVKNSTLASDTLMYTPDIIICKSDEDLPQRLSSQDWVNVDVMTMAAPNLSWDYLENEEQYEIHKKRARHMLQVAASKEADILVLGAFGCGAFQNNPRMVAEAYRDVLKEFDGVFQQIEFAIYCTTYDVQNYLIFSDTFE